MLYWISYSDPFFVVYCLHNKFVLEFSDLEIAVYVTVFKLKVEKYAAIFDFHK